MAYVSARYRDEEPDPLMGVRYIIALDDQGLEWHLPEDSEVGDWLRFLQEGGEIEPYQAPAEKPVPEPEPEPEEPSE